MSHLGAASLKYHLVREFQSGLGRFFCFVDIKRRDEELRAIYFHIAVFKFTVSSILNPSLSQALDFPWGL